MKLRAGTCKGLDHSCLSRSGCTYLSCQEPFSKTPLRGRNLVMPTFCLFGTTYIVDTLAKAVVGSTSSATQPDNAPLTGQTQAYRISSNKVGSNSCGVPYDVTTLVDEIVGLVSRFPK